MEKVKRYSLNIDVAMEIDYEGEYVLNTDYKALEADCQWAMEQYIAECLKRAEIYVQELFDEVTPELVNHHLLSDPNYQRAVKWLGEHP